MAMVIKIKSKFINPGKTSISAMFPLHENSIAKRISVVYGGLWLCERGKGYGHPFVILGIS